MQLRDSFKKHRCVVYDAHNHLVKVNGGDTADLLSAADLLGIDKLCVSRPLTDPDASPEDCRKANDLILDGMKISDRFIGFCFVNPKNMKESLAEVERCIVDHGMAGIKLYHQMRICDPGMAPLMKLAAKLGIPVLMHAGKCTDSTTLKRQPLLSNASHFIKACEMFPDTLFIQGHIGGGGDWEWNLRELEKAPANLRIDTSGSVTDCGIVRKTIDALGIDKVLFATDGIFEEGVGKVIDAKLSKDEWRKLLHDNFQAILDRRSC